MLSGSMEFIKQLCFSIWFYSLFLIFSAVGIPLMVVFVLCRSFMGSRRSLMRNYRRTISFYGRIVTRLPFPFIRVRFEDLSNTRPPGPFIFVCNHRSSSDPFLMSVLPFEAVQVVNTWPFKIPVLGAFAKGAGYLNVNDLSPDEFSRRAGKLLQEQVSIIFFPEGTRSGSRLMGNFHGTAFRLFLESRVPIIPICISGNEEIPRKGSLLLKMGAVHLRALPPVRWEDCNGSNAYAIKNRVRRRIESELALMEGF